MLVVSKQSVLIQVLVHTADSCQSRVNFRVLLYNYQFCVYVISLEEVGEGLSREELLTTSKLLCSSYLKIKEGVFLLNVQKFGENTADL